MKIHIIGTEWKKQNFKLVFCYIVQTDEDNGIADWIK
jgi:hypothetical protein